MTTVTGLTADRMLAIEAASVVDGDVDGSGNLILTKHDGTQINAGSVIGPTGPQGPIGSMVPVLGAVPILDVGLSGQIRAGRQLAASDFAKIGLNPPIGLWNLSDLTDVSGNGRNLNNKGAVPFDTGINGLANTAARFSGSNTQTLYISDTGVNDPFRIRTGSVGCWARTAKRGVNQMMVTKTSSAAPNLGWMIGNTSSNATRVYYSTDGTSALDLGGNIDICDDRWHFIVLTFDGSYLNLYVDNVLDFRNAAPLAFTSSGPLNINSWAGDGGSSAGSPHYGRIDEVFITSDVLSEDQIRNLYCAKILHTLGVAPSRVSLNVRRRRKGALLLASNFPTQPLRLHNFSGGSLGDDGSNGVALTISGAVVSIAGVDGSANNAYNVNGVLSSTGTGLPSGVASRSQGCWVKTTSIIGNAMFLVYGAAIATKEGIYLSAGNLNSVNAGDNIAGPFCADGQWHFVVVTEENAPTDGIKRKLYLDGRLVGTSTVLVSIGSGGQLRLGNDIDGTNQFSGQVDTVFICDYVLTADQIKTLYAKGSQELALSPKNVGDHVEAMDASCLLATFDTLDTQHAIDLGVA